MLIELVETGKTMFMNMRVQSTEYNPIYYTKIHTNYHLVVVVVVIVVVVVVVSFISNRTQQ